MATPCIPQIGFRLQEKLSIDFAGGQMTSDAGLVLLRELDTRLGLTRVLDRVVTDRRDGRYVQHPVGALLRQRIYQIAAGYEDAIDANLLRRDPTLQTVVTGDVSDQPLATQSTLSRLENAVDWDDVRNLQRLSLAWFLQHGHKVRRSARQEILLDVDSTDDPTHGHQQLALFHGKYNTYMYHPLLIFEGHTGHLLASRLRRGTAHDAEGVRGELRRLVPALRARFPDASIVLRADAGFASPDLYDDLEAESIAYLIGIPHHAAFRPLTDPMVARATARYERTNEPVRIWSSVRYRAHSWSHQRRILVKVEVSAQGTNVRCVITNRPGRAQELFTIYNGRGEAENRIDELKNDLKADRLSCSRYRANACRLQLHTLAYNLLAVFRHWLRGTALARAETSTLRQRLFKVGARVERTGRRLWFHLASGWPHRTLFLDVCRAIRRRRPAPT